MKNIFKNLKINTIFFATVTVLFGLYLISCRDSLGYDPNVEIIQVIKDTIVNPGNPGSKEFKIDSIQLYCIEYYRQHNRDDQEEWELNLRNKEIIIDTSEIYPKLWIELSAVTPKPDPDFDDRNDRVVAFNLNFGALLDREIFLLNGDLISRRWFNITVRDMRRKIEANLNGFDTRAQINFYEINISKGYIRAIFTCDFLRYPSLQTKMFKGFMTIYFKK